jgi:hypothetical protein
MKRMLDDASLALKTGPAWSQHGLLLGIEVMVFAWFVYQERTSPGSWIKLDFTDLILGVGAAWAVLSTVLVVWLKISSWAGLLFAHAASFFAVLAGLFALA